MKWFKRIILDVLLTPLFGVLVIALCNLTVIQYSKGRLYDNVKDIPYREVGVAVGYIAHYNKWRDKHLLQIQN